MLRTPESRMDILTPDEISSINSSSDLVRKYSQVIDRDSAYEILSRKVQEIQQEKADETAQKQSEKNGGGDWGRSTPSYTGRTSSRRPVMNPVVKVLTSATFLRGVMGILKKVI
jgi:protein subunit release factor B